MPFIHWNDKLSVGVEAMDQDHRQIVVMANELFDAIDNKHSREVLEDMIDQLVSYANDHFAREEELFRRAGYLEAAEHHTEHERIRAWINEINQRYRAGHLPAPSLEVMSVLKDLLFDHIAGSDKRYTAHLNAMGIY